MTSRALWKNHFTFILAMRENSESLLLSLQITYRAGTDCATSSLTNLIVCKTQEDGAGRGEDK